jgi:hypothetical protein
MKCYLDRLPFLTVPKHRRMSPDSFDHKRFAGAFWMGVKTTWLPQSSFSSGRRTVHHLSMVRYLLSTDALPGITSPEPKLHVIHRTLWIGVLRSGARKHNCCSTVKTVSRGGASTRMPSRAFYLMVRLFTASHVAA